MKKIIFSKIKPSAAENLGIAVRVGNRIVEGDYGRILLELG